MPELRNPAPVTDREIESVRRWPRRPRKVGRYSNGGARYDMFGNPFPGRNPTAYQYLNTPVREAVRQELEKARQYERDALPGGMACVLGYWEDDHGNVEVWSVRAYSFS